MTLSLRIATPADAPAIQAIYAPYVRETAVTFEYEVPSAEELAGRIETTLSRYPWIVAETEEGVVGYAYAGTFKNRKAYDWSVESSVYVRQDTRSQGIGRAVYSELERLLRMQGVANINACVAYTEGNTPRLNDASIRFHEKLGFKMVGVFHQCAYKFDTWYDMCWMEKHIAEHRGNQAELIPFPQLKSTL